MLAVFGWFPLLFYMVMRSMRDLYLLHFLGGISLVKLESRSQQISWLKKRSISFLLFTLIILVFWEGSHLPAQLGHLIGANQAAELMHVVYGFSAFLLVGAAQTFSWLKAILSTAPLAYLGRISYGLYLLHFIALKTITPWAIHFLEGIGMQSAGFKKLIALGATSLVLLPMCDLFFRFVEMPSIKLGKKMSVFLQNLIPNLKAGENTST
jgi:peptidoglycan/LPS O-acetylase OafA/YrhL